ncbi:helix-turn-helix domain-containing protein [Ruegeria arenilitoris]|uniref:helix-turn-helix domain-containing protein n=1 Tax=Ruegeria arenilitoris TaxID=1173585 RepID=UPI003464E2ED
MGMSRRTLQRKIEGSGASFRSVCVDAKMRKAAKLLVETSATVSSIAFELDYSTASHFSRAFSKQFGVTPLVFRHSKSSFN